MKRIQLSLHNYHFESSRFLNIYFMKKTIKIALRELYGPIRESIAKKQDNKFSSRLEEQLKEVFSLVKSRNSGDFNIIGSYLYDANREIKPPKLEGYSYAFPRFEKRKKESRSPLMEFKVVSLPEQITQTVYGIKIPNRSLPTVYPKLILVPLTCFNPISKHRVGYGGGYYDRYIEYIRQRNIDAVFIGIGAEQLKVSESFEGEGDQALDYIITQTTFY